MLFDKLISRLYCVDINTSIGRLFLLFIAIINHCTSTPCQNGATCSNLLNQYTCTCNADYAGTNCQTG